MDICLLLNFSASPVLKSFSFFDIGRKEPYFDTRPTEQKYLSEFKEKQLPLLDEVISACGRKDYKFSIYFSGPFLEWLEKHDSKRIESVRKQVEKEKIELLGGTYNGSAACLFSAEIFKAEVDLHIKKLKGLFDVEPICFVNSENIYSNSIAKLIHKHKFRAAVVPALDWYVPKDNSDKILLSKSVRSLSLILTDFRTSDFLMGSLESAPLLSDDDMKNKLINIQVDPTILAKGVDWKRKMSGLRRRKNKLLSVSDAIALHSSEKEYDIPSTVALNPSGHDLSYFNENPLQKEFLNKLKSIKGQLNTKKDKQVFNDLMLLATTKNLIDLSTKIRLNEITGPYDHYLHLMNILADLEIRTFRHKL